jgi:biotin carboxyl carrier protein
MYTITVNGQTSIKTDITSNGTSFAGVLNEKAVSGDIIKISPYQFHIIHNSASYNVDIIKMNAEEKTMVIKVNSVKFNLQLKDKYDELLHTLGLDNLASKKVSDIKAPMPGMVLNVLVSEGTEVKKGDALIVLEAMKMENILKSPTDGVIKKVSAVKGNAVEKNQVLIQF